MPNYVYKIPIPFNGQKRYWVKDFLKILDNFPKDATYLDL